MRPLWQAASTGAATTNFRWSRDPRLKKKKKKIQKKKNYKKKDERRKSNKEPRNKKRKKREKGFTFDLDRSVGRSINKRGGEYFIFQ